MHDNNLIKDHYKKVAEKFKDSSSSTMTDETIRNKEIEFIKLAISRIKEKTNEKLKILDIGCGNGYTLSELKNNFVDDFFGLEYTDELFQIANSRDLSDVSIVNGDVRDMPYSDNSIDIIYTERCLINLLEWDEQKKALNEISRVLKPGGYYIMIEAFEDAQENYNRARTESGLEEIPVSYHNRYFNKNELFSHIEEQFRVVSPIELREEINLANNFLSSHYFVSRVMHPLLVKDINKKNSEFVKFFSFLNGYGNYSPIQGYILNKNGK